jgi:NAD(P)-dependent dehydrogenase (short-subunit alcohol dehydrogenase family)
VSELQGKVAVTTGRTQGIGFATAKLFVKEDAYVFITGRLQKELDEAVKAIGSNVTGVEGILTNRPTWKRSIHNGMRGAVRTPCRKPKQ